MDWEVNWPLTFQGFETFLSPLAEASWPLGFLVALWIFRKEIRALIPRIRSIKGVGVEAELLGEAQQQDTSSTAATALPGFGTEYPPPHPVFTDLDQFLRNVLESEIGGDAEKKLAWAIRVRSASEAARIHEANLRVIFGSQLRALRALNIVGQAPAADFEPYYEEAKKDPANAAAYENRTFEDWGRFMLQTGYVAEVEATDPPEVRITPLGQHFLMWITEARVWDQRPG